MTSRLRFASDRRSWPSERFILWSIDREEPSTVPGKRERKRDIGPAVNVEGLDAWLPWFSQSPSLRRSDCLQYVHEPGRCCTLGIHNAFHIRDIIIPGIPPLPASSPLPIYLVPLGNLPSPGRCTGRRQFVGYFPSLPRHWTCHWRRDSSVASLGKHGRGPFLSCSLLIPHNRYTMTRAFQVQRGKAPTVGGHLYGVF